MVTIVFICIFAVYFITFYFLQTNSSRILDKILVHVHIVDGQYQVPSVSANGINDN